MSVQTHAAPGGLRRPYSEGIPDQTAMNENLGRLNCAIDGKAAKCPDFHMAER
jgi:hypothetical protein